MMEKFWGALIVALLWVLREIGGHLISDAANRFGRVRFISNGRQFLKRFELPDGSIVEGAYMPTPDAAGSERLTTVSFTGTFVNETKAPVIFKNAKLLFAGPGGSIIHDNPGILAQCRAGDAVVLAPQSACAVTIRASIFVSKLPTTYLDSKAYLVLQTMRDREIRFSLGSIYDRYLLNYRASMDDKELSSPEVPHIGSLPTAGSTDVARTKSPTSVGDDTA